MTHDEFLQTIYARFRQSGEWPLVRALQNELGAAVHVRRIAGEIGLNVVVADEGQEGRCWLKLEGVARCPAGADDVENLLRTVRYFAEHPDAGSVTSAQLGAILQLNGLELKRLGRIVHSTSGSWTATQSGPVDGSFVIQPDEYAIFYKDVDSVASLNQTRQRLTDDSIAASHARNRNIADALRWPAAEQESPEDAAPLPVVPDIRLRHASHLQPVLDRDLSELRLTLAARAWKGAAILAGACLETLLLDVWYGNVAEAQKRWKGDWPDDVTAAKLAEAAAEHGLISRTHKDVASTIRRARNLVHPSRAAKEPRVSRALADALTALLRLLAEELRLAAPEGENLV